MRSLFYHDVADNANMLLSLSDDGVLAWIVVAGLSLWWSPITKGIFLFTDWRGKVSCDLLMRKVLYKYFIW